MPERMEHLAAPHYAISMTTRCQQQCVFCFEGERSKRNDVPTERVKEQIVKASCEVPAVVFMGAESTLHPSFLEIVRFASSRGLRVAVSTNLQRFADMAFLCEAISAGLDSLEFSFHYPDTAAFEAITRTPAKRYARLLQAMANVEAVADGRVDGHSDALAGGVNVNIVPNAVNTGRLGEVLDNVVRLMPVAFRVATFKRLETQTLGASPCSIDEKWIPEASKLRDDLVHVLGGRSWTKALPVLRGFPLCIAPGFEEHHVNLVSYGRQTTIAENFGPRTSFKPMYKDVAHVEAGAHVGACEGCPLVGLCHAVTEGALAFSVPGLTPIPVRRDPLEVLERCGLMPDDARRFLERADAARRGQIDESRTGLNLDPERVGKVVRLAFARLAHRFGPISLAGVRRRVLPEWGTSIGLELRLREDLMRLWVVQRRSGMQCFEAGKQLMLVHDELTPLDTDEKRDVARVVLRVCERALVTLLT